MSRKPDAGSNAPLKEQWDPFAPTRYDRFLNSVAGTLAPFGLTAAFGFAALQMGASLESINTSLGAGLPASFGLSILLTLRGNSLVENRDALSMFLRTCIPIMGLILGSELSGAMNEEVQRAYRDEVVVRSIADYIHIPAP